MHHARGLFDFRKAVSRVEPDGGGEIGVRFEIELVVPVPTCEPLHELQKPVAEPEPLRLVREIELLHLRAVGYPRKLGQSPAAKQRPVFAVQGVIDALFGFSS